MNPSLKPRPATDEPIDVLEFGMALVKATPAFRARVNRLAAPRGEAGRLIQTTLRRAWQDRDHFPADRPVEAWLVAVFERQIRPSTQV